VQHMYHSLLHLLNNANDLLTMLKKEQLLAYDINGVMEDN
jgi:hypothetical protein